jgi:Uma2 family endonuclease
MLAAKMDDYITEQEYLEGEKLAKERHEYVDGKVYAMAGTSRRHNRIAVNIVRKLPLANHKGQLCEINSSDVKVRVGKRKTYYYPDVVVGCDADDTNPYYLEKPCLIVEVTSKSTEWKDRHEKAVVYQSLESLQAYMVVSQEKPHVTLYYREEDDGSWWVTALESMDQTITLKCPETTLTLADIYDGIDFSQPAE